MPIEVMQVSNSEERHSSEVIDILKKPLCLPLYFYIKLKKKVEFRSLSCIFIDLIVSDVI